MLYITSLFFLLGSGGSSCPRPPFGGDPSSPMYPSAMLERAARRSTIPSQTEVYASANVARIMRVLPETRFNVMFPRANEGRGPAAGNGPYTYFNFLKAAAMWPAFCNESHTAADLDSLCKKELASMFAHFSQEVGEHDPYSQYPMWQQGLYYYNELGCSNNPSASGCEYTGGTCDASTWMGQIWQCPAGVKYFGRGAKQLSYNFNYGPFSYALFGDVNVLLRQPWLVTSNDATNGWLALASAFWFYMTPQSPKPSMHDVVTGFWTPNAGDIAGKRVRGFGVLIMIINGGIECGGQTEIQQSANRIEFYKGFLTAFELPQDDPSTLGCAKMQQFDSSSSAFTPSYWEESWQTQSCGVSCQLVSYQTGFSIFDDPLAPDVPYNKCIQYYYGGATTTTPTTAASTSSLRTSSGVASSVTGLQTTTKLATTTAAPTTVRSTTPGSKYACAACETCVAVPGNIQSASDAHCAPCGSGTLQAWWPCDISGLCQCAGGPTATPKPTTTSTTTKTVSGASVNPCATCTVCEAIPGNIAGSIDSNCVPCGSGTLQTWWPCNRNDICRCKAR